MASGAGLADALAFLEASEGHPRFFLGTPEAWRCGSGIARRTEAEGAGALAGLAPAEGFVGFAFDPKRPWPGFAAAAAFQPARSMVAGVPRPPFPRPVPVPATPSLHLPETSRSRWNASFARIQAAIASGTVSKAVLARCAHLPRADPVRLLAALLGREPATTAFLFEPTPGLALVGATPETLAQVTDGRLLTHALAGTPRRGGRMAPPSEHGFVVEDMLARLRPIVDARAGERTLLRLRGLEHEMTPIEGTLRPGTGVLEAAAVLHPTPAVAGTPRDAAVRLLAAEEEAPRGWYAGGVGWVSGGSGHVHVALRCALVADRTYAWAGAGIVAGSDAEDEWLETEAKLQAVRGAVEAAA